MKQATFFLAVFAALMATFYLRELLGESFVIIALLFGGSLATAGLHYIDCWRRNRRGLLKDE